MSQTLLWMMLIFLTASIAGIGGIMVTYAALARKA